MEQHARNTSRISYMVGTQAEGDLLEKNIQNITVRKSQGMSEFFHIERMRTSVEWASQGLEAHINSNKIINEAIKNVFDGISPLEISEALILASVAFIEEDPAYGYVAARLLFKKLFKEVTGHSALRTDSDFLYQQAFVDGINYGAQHGVFDRRLLDFDLEYLAQHLKFERDLLFDFMGFRTLYERYFIKHESVRLELPQAFWMRVAMGLCYNEPLKNERAVQFYNILSTFRYVPGTPTLLHAGLSRPQLSSCFLSTVEDDLVHIFKCYGDNAQLSKWSGGVANDWTNIRACGAMVDSIRTESQGLIPFLKIVNDVTAAINRSGKRRGATCVYLEVWHYEIEDFLDLRKNTGDERRRTHDINTANWIPDLFMKRVIADQEWTLFSPDDVPDLHHLYGKAFEKRYEEYEEHARKGEIKLFRVVSARQLWRKMLSRLFESGHPWITFKDAANIRSPQDHAGVIHSSNLCTEILLNTSAEETAVCNLGSINLAIHIIDGQLDIAMLANTIEYAVRMLDNVIDINFYPTVEAKTANMRHRPVGLGLMGFQDALYKLNINFSSLEAAEFADESMEIISYYAILSSCLLAQERGTYSSYKGSKWDRGIFPQDTIDLLEQERGMRIEMSRGGKLDWTYVRNQVREYGLRNSNVMAIAPTATISNIVGCFPCIEPIYKNLYVKANMSGEFTVVNKYLIQDLKNLGLWNREMIDQLKYYDGSVQKIEMIPQHLKDKYKEAFEIDALFLIELTARRGKWIDQSQSHNVFMKGVSGQLLYDIYITAWKKGLKTTYYLRTLGATQIEKSTLDANKYGFTQKREYESLKSNRNDTTNHDENGNGGTSSDTHELGSIKVATLSKEMQDTMLSELTKSCSLSEDPECEVCQ